MTLEIRHLQLMRAVAAWGGLTRAGHHLHLSQSALSHQLHDVEARLGTRLFLRVGKRMVLTTAGTRLLRSAEEVLDVLQRTEDELIGLATGRHGVIRLSAGRFTGYHWLPPVLKAYRQLHPEIDVQIDAHGIDDPVRLLLDGLLDVGIIGGSRGDARVVERPLFEDELVLIIEPRHPLASRPFAHASDFLGQQVLLDTPNEENGFYNEVLAPAGVRPASIQHVPQLGALIELVKSGLGIAVLPKWVATPYLTEGGLRSVRIARTAGHAWSAVVLKEMEEVGYIQAFLDVIVRVTRPLARKAAVSFRSASVRSLKTRTRARPLT